VPAALGRFDGLKVAIDCANGRRLQVGPDALEELGAEARRESAQIPTAKISI